MAVNMYSAFWTLIVCVSVLIGVSLFTEPKPESELHNLVMGLTPLPVDGPGSLVQASSSLGRGRERGPGGS